MILLTGGAGYIGAHVCIALLEAGCDVVAVCAGIVRLYNTTGLRDLGPTVLDLRPYIRRPISTFAAIAANPAELWVRLRDRYAAHREGHTLPDLYRPNSGELVSEFCARWPLFTEMQERGVVQIRRASTAELIPHAQKAEIRLFLPLRSICPRSLVKPILQSKHLKIEVAHCPERAIPGNTLHEVMTASSEPRRRSLYSTFPKVRFTRQPP